MYIPYWTKVHWYPLDKCSSEDALWFQTCRIWWHTWVVRLECREVLSPKTRKLLVWHVSDVIIRRLAKVGEGSVKWTKVHPILKQRSVVPRRQMFKCGCSQTSNMSYMVTYMTRYVRMPRSSKSEDTKFHDLICFGRQGILSVNLSDKEELRASDTFWDPYHQG
jgi:hypothetical protein